MDLDALQAFARYNRWMNDKLLATAESLADAERKRERGVIFGSIHGIFNHLLVADRIWIGRFTDAEVRKGWMGPGGIRALDQELYAEFDALKAARAEMDDAIEQWVTTLTPARLAEPLTKPAKPAMPLWCAVMHMFNHQTHHRGQISALLVQAGADPGVTDLFAMLRDEHREG